MREINRKSQGQRNFNMSQRKLGMNSHGKCAQRHSTICDFPRIPSSHMWPPTGIGWPLVPRKIASFLGSDLCMIYPDKKQLLRIYCCSLPEIWEAQCPTGVLNKHGAMYAFLLTTSIPPLQFPHSSPKDYLKWFQPHRHLSKRGSNHAVLLKLFKIHEIGTSQVSKSTGYEETKQDSWRSSQIFDYKCWLWPWAVFTLGGSMTIIWLW